jgi:hypothetical protein
MSRIGLIAGKGAYPQLVFDEAKKLGHEVYMVAFDTETDPDLAAKADKVEWLNVGQLTKMIKFFVDSKVDGVILAGQITPARLYDVKPDLKALLLLVRLKERNAETIFGAIINEIEHHGVKVLPATTFLDSYLAQDGYLAGPKPLLGAYSMKQDIEFGWPIAKQVSMMDIGQTIVVKKGTVLAVEGFDGTNETIRRGGKLGKGHAVVVKVAKPNQDMRFDVPVIGPATIMHCAESGVNKIICESGKTLLVEKEKMEKLARELKVTVWGHSS